MKADVSALLLVVVCRWKARSGTWKRQVDSRHTLLGELTTPMGTVDAWLGTVPLSNRSQYAVIYAVVVSVQRFDGSNKSLISAAGVCMQR